MDKNLKFEELKEFLENSETTLGKDQWAVISPFLKSYEQILDSKKLDKNYYFKYLAKWFALTLKQITDPIKFEHYHAAIREPEDFHELGKEIFRPLINLEESTLSGVENLKEVESALNRGENAIFFANHQIEADPQALSLLLEDVSKRIGEETIFVAGSRVWSDPVSAPFSAGVNLFCIYSKKYFAAHEDRADEMKIHNTKTIGEMSSKLNEGGKCIFIAPSGGRDRKSDSGVIEVSPFDSKSIELMYLLGKKSKKITHFYPLAVSTHDILPPPEGLQIKLGETRHTKEAPIHAHYGKKIDMENFPFSDTTSKKRKKEARTQHIFKLVCEMYDRFPSL